MPTTFRPYHPEQSLLLPPSPQDWLPENHLAYFISEVVESVDLSGFYARYEGDGRRNCPFDPRMMVKILLYSYATGTFSSRKIARRLHEDVALRVLAAENFPAHRTIAEFRERHLAEFEPLCVDLVRIARQAGLARLGIVAVDGTKVKALGEQAQSDELRSNGPRATASRGRDCRTASEGDPRSGGASGSEADRRGSAPRP